MHKFKKPFGFVMNLEREIKWLWLIAVIHSIIIFLIALAVIIIVLAPEMPSEAQNSPVSALYPDLDLCTLNDIECYTGQSDASVELKKN